jgi:hypothetical protein
MSKCQAKDCEREVKQYKYFSIECSIYGEAQMKKMEVEPTRSYYLNCICGSDEHRIVFTVDPDEDFTEMYLSVFLSENFYWWKRWWMALKYAMGYKCAYGHFGNWSLNQKDVQILRDALDDFEKTYAESKNKKKENNV